MAPTRRRKATEWVSNQRARDKTFSDRSKGQIKKCYGLKSVTGASIAFIALPDEATRGDVHCFGSPSVDEVCFEFFRQWCNKGMTNEEMASLTAKCQALLGHLDNRSKVGACADQESRLRAGVVKDSERNFETSHPLVLASPEYSDDIDGDKRSTSESNFTTKLTIAEHPSGGFMVCPCNESCSERNPRAA